MMNLILFSEEEIQHKLAYNDERAVHIRTILKSKPGDSLSVGVINGLKGKAEILEIDKEGISFKFSLSEQALPPHPLTLIIGAIRPITARRLLKDLTTLGVESIILAATTLSEKSYFKSNLWQKKEFTRFLIDGAQQSGTSLIPRIERVYSLKAALQLCEKDISPETNKWALDNINPSGSLSETQVKGEHTILTIGPERGWAEKERNILEDYDYKRLSMGKRILRTETACTAAVAIALSKTGLI